MSEKNGRLETEMTCNFNIILNGALVCALAVLSYKYSVLYQEQHLEKPGQPGNVCADDYETHSPPPKRASSEEESEAAPLRTGSSVWCRGENIDYRQCRFRHLCVDPTRREYVFLHGPETLISGVELTSQKTPMVDLSSVSRHNIMQVTLVDIPVERVTELYTVKTFTQPSLLFYRFKPDNLMHIFHDDLLPLFFTYLELCGGSLVHCPQELQLVFVDPWPEGPHAELYGIFTALPPLILSNHSEGELMCFKDVYVGVSKRTSWYDYGFTSPQGPKANPTVTAMDIRRFTDFFVDRFPQITPRTCGAKSVALLLTRKNTRLILNEDEVVTAIGKESNLPVEVFSLDEHSLADIISHIRCADLLVGMHGALLIVAMFLRPGAAFLELFPYAIPPGDYTPYKTLVHLPAMGIIYRHWVNEKDENTVTHPDWPPELGGIAHLSMPQRQRLEDVTTVDPHLCCDNPAWLFRIYQDTKVDIESFSKTLRDALAEKSTFTPEEHVRQVIELNNALIFPSKVEELYCQPMTEDPGLQISWQPPKNLLVVPSSAISYEVWTQIANEEDYKMVEANETSRVLRGIAGNTYVNVWVRCKVDNDRLGSFNWIGCFTEDAKPPGITY